MLIATSMYLIAVIAIAGYNMATAKTMVKRRSSGTLLLSVALIVAFVVIDDLLYIASVLPVAYQFQERRCDHERSGENAAESGK